MMAMPEFGEDLSYFLAERHRCGAIDSGGYGHGGEEDGWRRHRLVEREGR